VVIRFDGRNRRAEEWIRDRAGRLIREITDDQREAIRAVIEAGQVAGRNPRATALDIAGRIENGRRVGGIIGLTSKQAGYVQSARAELEELSEAYFERKLRDKRFDRTVAKAIRDGKALSAADTQRIVDRYSDKMLSFRAENIARTEAISALHAAQYEAMQQLVDSGKVRADQITKVWSATMDTRTRDTHQAMNGQAVGFFAAFVSPSGAQLRYPHDTSLGAPADEIIACRCFMQTKIKYL
jgi:hypothetical protein